MSMKKNLIRGMQAIGQMRAILGEWSTPPKTKPTRTGGVSKHVYDEEPEQVHDRHRRNAE